MGQRRYKLVLYSAISRSMYASNYAVQITQTHKTIWIHKSQKNNVKKKEKEAKSEHFRVCVCVWRPLWRKETETQRKMLVC